MRRYAFAATADGPPIVEVSWREPSSDEFPPEDLRVRFEGTEILRQDHAESRLEAGLALQLPDKRYLFIRLEPQPAASIGEQDLFLLRKWKP